MRSSTNFGGESKVEVEHWVNMFCANTAVHAYSLGINVMFVARNDIGIGTSGLQVEQSITDFAVRRVKWVTDAIERVADVQCVDVKWYSVEKTHRREQKRPR